MKILLVANDGGHLQQLYQLKERFTVTGQVLWVTNDSAQSRSLLREEVAHYLPHVDPRDTAGVLRGARLARRVVAEFRPDLAVSTGASLALSVLPLVMGRRKPVHFIESATRVSGPSMSGRLLSLLPGVNLYSQYPARANGRWEYRGSVFDDYVAHQTQRAPGVARVVVSVGTSKGYGFPRLIQRVWSLVGDDVEVFWQTGSTDTSGLPIDAHVSVPSDELRSRIAAADVVITHAGTGSAIASLEAGKRPILVPRDPARGEHVDDHQMQIAGELGRRELAWNVDAEDLTMDLMETASVWAVRKRADRQPFELIGA